MTEDYGAALLIELAGAQALACRISSTDCSVCHSKMEQLPAMLLYRPAKDIFDLVCRECGFAIMHAARARIADPEYTG